MSAKCEGKIVVFGGKQFTVIASRTDEESTVFERLFEPVTCDDWLHSAVWINDNIVALLTAHNVVQVSHSSSLQSLFELGSTIFFIQRHTILIYFIIILIKEISNTY